MVDIDRIIKNTIKKGSVIIGTKKTKTSLTNGTAKMVVMSKNYPFSSEIKKIAKEKKIPIYIHNSSSIELGYICGKAFAVSVFAVIDDGGANISQLLKR